MRSSLPSGSTMWAFAARACADQLLLEHQRCDGPARGGTEVGQTALRVDVLE
jgi:hypothetical protein